MSTITITTKTASRALPAERQAQPDCARWRTPAREGRRNPALADGTICEDCSVLERALKRAAGWGLICTTGGWLGEAGPTGVPEQILVFASREEARRWLAAHPEIVLDLQFRLREVRVALPGRA